MIMAAPELKRSPFPFSPLMPSEIPERISVAAVDQVLARGSVDQPQTARIWLDLERRARLDAEYLEHVETKALDFAGALGEIDALHIEWGNTHLDVINNVQLWERLGAILRKAGI